MTNLEILEHYLIPSPLPICFSLSEEKINSLSPAGIAGKLDKDVLMCVPPFDWREAEGEDKFVSDSLIWFYCNREKLILYFVQQDLYQRGVSKEAPRLYEPDKIFNKGLFERGYKHFFFNPGMNVMETEKL